jgi:hypothetical protein
MALTTRMLPANIVGGVVTGRCGSPNPADSAARFYSAGGGQTIDAQGPPDADASTLTSQGFLLVAASGTTALRNSLGGTYFKAGTLFCDTSLQRVIMYDGVNWRDVMNGNIV